MKLNIDKKEFKYLLRPNLSSQDLLYAKDTEKIYMYIGKGRLKVLK